ncbi:MAG: hypothetical protein CL878_13470 [Dehalococcoidia bacterium]|nr:hypothetical protein [Dehalococcoidia bacterium]
MAERTSLTPTQQSASRGSALAALPSRRARQHDSGTQISRDTHPVVEPRPSTLLQLRVAKARGRGAEDLAGALSWLAHAPRIPPLSGADRLRMMAQLAVLAARIESDPQAALDAQANVARPALATVE